MRALRIGGKGMAAEREPFPQAPRARRSRAQELVAQRLRGPHGDSRPPHHRMIDCAYRAEFASAARGEFAMPNAVVMCGGGQGAYDIVRTLGLAGIRSAVFASH